ERRRAPRDPVTVQRARARAVTAVAGGTRRAADVRMNDEVVRNLTAAAPPRIIALSFDSPPLAQHALHEARRMHEEQRLAVHDAVVVSAEHGTPMIVESLDPTPLAAAVPSALLGALVGSILAGP